MNPMKRVGMAAVLVVGVGLLGNTTAWARGKPKPYVIELMPVGDEPQASGVASFTVLRVEQEFLGPFGARIHYSGKLTVTCVNLTPGATYSTPAGTFTADATGAGSASAQKVTLSIFVYEGYVSPCIIDVVRLNPDDSTTTVLAGEFYGW